MNEQPITSDMTIGTVIEKYPQTTEVLLGYGLQCVGCAVNPYETIEQGVLGHGMSKDSLQSLLEEANMVVTKKAPYEMNPEGITLSPNAIDTLMAMMEAEGKKDHGLKVDAQKEDGGLNYFLDIVESGEEGDKELLWEGVKIYVNEPSLKLMAPSVIDYVHMAGGEGFKIIALKEEEATCKCNKPLSECGCANGKECKGEKKEEKVQTGCGGNCACS